MSYSYECHVKVLIYTSATSKIRPVGLRRFHQIYPSLPSRSDLSNFQYQQNVDGLFCFELVVLKRGRIRMSVSMPRFDLGHNQRHVRHVQVSLNHASTRLDHFSDESRMFKTVSYSSPSRCSTSPTNTTNTFTASKLAHHSKRHIRMEHQEL